MRVELRRDLDAVMARRVRRKVNRLTREVAVEAARRAPGAKVWITRDDERVRPSHADAHEQTIPANIQFKLRRPIGQVLSHGTYDLAWMPRDPNLPANQVIRCRCVGMPLPGVIAARIRTSPAVVTGTQTRGQVSVRFTRIQEAEFGSGDARGARFMGGAIDVVAARLRSASARRT